MRKHGDAVLEKRDVAGRLRQEEAGGEISPVEEECCREEKGAEKKAAVLNVGCILPRIHKRVLLYSPSQSSGRSKKIPNTSYIFYVFTFKQPPLSLFQKSYVLMLKLPS